ncbi:MAG TPA: oxidoreductase [Bryobacteraceae bacterium]|nr:oxidoreductase [Bryobacteraceae bacterium]
MPTKQVVLVTGVTSGIGRATALALANRGFRAFGTMRKPTELPGVEVLALDVRDAESVRAAVQKVIAAAGRIDVLINNAGYTLIGALEETSIEEAVQLFETNFFGVLRLTNAVLPVMREQGYGRVINIGSVAGFVPMPFQGLYAASKHALEGLSESLDHEVRQFGIRVSVIEPGFMRTAIDQHRQVASHPLETYKTAREQVLAVNPRNVAQGDDPGRVAAIVVKAIQSPSPRLRYLAGRQAILTNLLVKFLPAAVFDAGLRKQSGLAAV